MSPEVVSQLFYSAELRAFGLAVFDLVGRPKRHAGRLGDMFQVADLD